MENVLVQTSFVTKGCYTTGNPLRMEAATALGTMTGVTNNVVLLSPGRLGARLCPRSGLGVFRLKVSPRHHTDERSGRVHADRGEGDDRRLRDTRCRVPWSPK